MSGAQVEVTEFSDPGCPWAFSSEPARRRLRWLFGDQLRWRLVMVGLSDSPEEYLEKDLTPEKLAQGAADIAAEHGMPINATVQPRTQATAPACRAVIAAQLFAPQTGRAMMRALQVEGFDGALLDRPETLSAAATRAGIDPGELREWMERPEVAERFERDRAEARSPSATALALDYKLADWSGGRRYTCPSYRFTRLADGAVLEAPGFHTALTYEVLLANLVPELERAAEPDEVAEVLRWAGEPLATQEVATVCGIGRDEARQRLRDAGATERPSGSESYWFLIGAG